MRASIILIALIALIAASCLFIKNKIDAQMTRMKTLDTIGQILAAMDKGLTSNSRTEYNPVKEARKMFPLIPEKNGYIIDAWGNPISISIQKAESGFRIHIASAGSDEMIGSADDIIRDEFLRD